MAVKHKLHILHSVDKGSSPVTALSMCGRHFPYGSRHRRFATDWDESTCKICIAANEDIEPDWTHPSNRLH